MTCNFFLLDSIKSSFIPSREKNNQINKDAEDAEENHIQMKNHIEREL